MSDVQRVAVIGLGTMGHGIAQSYALAGFDVVGFDDVGAARDSLQDRVRRNLEAFVGAGILAEERIEPALGRLSAAASEEAALLDADFVVEAIVEDLSAKLAFFARAEGVVSRSTILASNSSSFPISASGANLKHPERGIVTHWFNPPHIIPTVEVVPSDKTSEETIQTTIAMLKRAGKLPIRINKELPGFLVNRVQIAMQREIWDLLDKGVASVEDIDAALSSSVGLRLAALGPLRISDFGGLDVHTAVVKILAPDITNRTTVPDVVQEIVDGGNLGFKTGKGFYEYTPESAAEAQRDRDAKYLALYKMFYADRLGPE